MTPKCSHLIAIAALAAAGTLAGPAGAATLASGSGVNLNLSPAVKTAATLPYLGAAKLVATVPIGNHDHDHALQARNRAHAEGSFVA